MEYGYARVSAREQNEERQLIALREFGLNGGQTVTVKAEDGWTHMGQWGEVAKLPPTITRSGVYSNS